ncbi:rhamnogalacturonate lyase C like protein [Verticillium longisporum]|uniref:Rhamnogalacturonate lyase C like protein n=1 Tax=Verticillium longisporum TaxID=100787 RepID=A0A8I2ZJ81_VERLO|nr:rhamnogalacturonate lyase C like protein [Verticillium longisporum]KAG7131418.1 rhamnogalacturonate lyase C like protein [Verticillium longisporum]
MAILQRLGLRRRSRFDPQTPLDAFLDSPLQTLISALYALLLTLRGRPYAPPTHNAIRVVCLSDTHDLLPADPVPEGDLLIHAGDLSTPGTAAALQAQIDFLAAQPHTHKVLVAGNHDAYFDPNARSLADRTFRATLDLKGVHYLQHEALTLTFAARGRRRLRLYGAPDIPRCGPADFAFQYDAAAPPWQGAVPADTDVLITHTPPFAHRDLRLGCPALLAELWRVRPRLHVFGHVHFGHGREAAHYDGAQAAYESLVARRGGPVRDLLPSGAWIDALKVAAYGLHAVVFKVLMLGPGGNTGGTWLVNAGLMKGNSGKLGNPPQVVVL